MHGFCTVQYFYTEMPLLNIKMFRSLAIALQTGFTAFNSWCILSRIQFVTQYYYEGLYSYPYFFHFAADESDVFNSRCSKWARFLDERGLEEPDDTVTCSSVMSTTRLITETPKNTYKTAAKEKSEIKEQTSHLPLLNSSEQETVFYDGINKVFHTNMDTTSVHQNMDSCFLSDEENQPNELCRKEYVENPSIEVQQGISTNLGDRNSESVQLPTIRNTYPPLRHVPAQCNSINTSTKLQKVLHPEFKLMGGDSEDELDNILSF
jgi:hypothetical protein